MHSYQYKHGDRPLEGFTIQRAAGRGGFGEVYYAISDSGREVALKVVQGYEQIELRGVNFELTPDIEQELRRAGAQDAVIAAVRRNYRKK